MFGYDYDPPAVLAPDVLRTRYLTVMTALTSHTGHLNNKDLDWRSPANDRSVRFLIAHAATIVRMFAPGFIQTEMTRATAERLGEPWESCVAQRAAAIPVARAGLPDDVANAVSFFCGEAAGFVSGQVLYVAGGPRG